MSDSNLFSTLETFRSKPDAQKVFGRVSEELGVSGWSLAKNLDLAPEDTANILHDLTDKGVLKATDEGLDGNYSLTGLGFSLKEQLSGGV
jgi:hypothetical protein